MLKITKVNMVGKEDGTQDDLLKFVFESEMAAAHFRMAMDNEGIKHFSLGRKSTVFVAMDADKV